MIVSGVCFLYQKITIEAIIHVKIFIIWDVF